MQNLKLTYGIISTASIGIRFITAVRESGGVVEAAASRTLQKARQFCAEYKIPRSYGSYQELYQDEKIDIVYISTINSEHYSEIMQALSYGKHVLCEKPLTLNEEQAREAFEYARSRRLFLMEMQKSVFLPVTNIVKDYIDNKKLGALHQIDMSASFDNPSAEWMHDPKQGGVVYGSASYTFEYLDYLLEPKDTIVQALATKEASQTIDSVSINIKMDQTLINSRITMRAPADSFAVFYFTKGMIKIKEYWKANRCEIYTGNGVEVIAMPDGVESPPQGQAAVRGEMKYELEHVAKCIRMGLTESPVMPAERTLKCCRMVDQMMRSL